MSAVCNRCYRIVDRPCQSDTESLDCRMLKRKQITYTFDLVCPRCGKTSQTVTEHREPPPVVNCGDCLMNHVEVVEFKIVSVTITAILLMLLLGTDVSAQQRTVYGPDGRVQSTIVTGSDGTVTIYAPNGRRISTITPPPPREKRR